MAKAVLEAVVKRLQYVGFLSSPPLEGTEDVLSVLIAIVEMVKWPRELSRALGLGFRGFSAHGCPRPETMADHILIGPSTSVPPFLLECNT